MPVLDNTTAKHTSNIPTARGPTKSKTATKVKLAGKENKPKPQTKAQLEARIAELQDTYHDENVNKAFIEADIAARNPGHSIDHARNKGDNIDETKLRISADENMGTVGSNQNDRDDEDNPPARNTKTRASNHELGDDENVSVQANQNMTRSNGKTIQANKASQKRDRSHHVGKIPASESEADSDDEIDRRRTQPEAPTGIQRSGNGQSRTIHDVVQIRRPKGTPGTDWSIAIEMGLAGSTKKKEKYNLLKREIRDISMNARLSWQEDWRDIPAADKATFFAVCRERHPFLAKFHNDWATEVIVRQYFSNKRKTNYQKGYLKVPKKYEYLADNAAKRDQTKSRKPRADAVREARKKALKRAKMRSKGKQQESKVSDAMDVGEELGGELFVEGSSKDGKMDVDGEGEGEGNSSD